MESKTFIKKEIDKLTKKYPFSKIEYYFDNFDKDHFICVDSRYNLDRILSKEAVEIDKEFIERFPNELLSFIEIDDELEFDELVYKKEGIDLIDHLRSKNIDDFLFPQQMNFNLLDYKVSTTIYGLEEDYAFAA